MLGTHQEEHPLLQALLGELVEAALSDKLLEDRQGVAKSKDRQILQDPSRRRC